MESHRFMKRYYRIHFLREQRQQTFTCSDDTSIDAKMTSVIGHKEREPLPGAIRCGRAAMADMSIQQRISFLFS